MKRARANTGVNQNLNYHVYPERFEKSEVRSITSIANTKRIADMVREYITSSTSEKEKQQLLPLNEV
ncbi:hypothetical protein [Streptococcus vestibularis]